jgi:hypothetical protein
VIYQPLTGVDFLKRLMTPVPRSSVLFMLQSGYAPDRIMPIMLDSINGLNNSSAIASLSSRCGKRQELEVVTFGNKKA